METVSSIIKRRKRGSFNGCVLVIIALVAAAATNTTGGNFMVLVISGIVLLGPLLAIYSVNVRNYPEPKPYYRTFNKVVYLWGSKFGLVGSTIDFVVDIRQAANPFEKLTEGAAASSKAADLIDAAVDAGVGYQMYRQIKPAEAVEQYFATKSQAVPQTVPQETPSSDTIGNSRP